MQPQRTNTSQKEVSRIYEHLKLDKCKLKEVIVLLQHGSSVYYRLAYINNNMFDYVFTCDNATVAARYVMMYISTLTFLL